MALLAITGVYVQMAMVHSGHEIHQDKSHYNCDVIVRF